MMVTMGWTKGRNAKIKTLNFLRENLGDYSFYVVSVNITIIRYFILTGLENN